MCTQYCMAAQCNSRYALPDKHLRKCEHLRRAASVRQMCALCSHQTLARAWSLVLRGTLTDASRCSPQQYTGSMRLATTRMLQRHSDCPHALALGFMRSHCCVKAGMHTAYVEVRGVRVQMVAAQAALLPQHSLCCTGWRCATSDACFASCSVPSPKHERLR